MNVQIARQLIMASNLFQVDHELAWLLYETALDCLEQFGNRANVQAILVEFGSDIIVTSTADPAHPTY